MFPFPGFFSGPSIDIYVDAGTTIPIGDSCCDPAMRIIDVLDIAVFR